MADWLEYDNAMDHPRGPDHYLENTVILAIDRHCKSVKSFIYRPLPRYPRCVTAIGRIQGNPGVPPSRCALEGLRVGSNPFRAPG